MAFELEDDYQGPRRKGKYFGGIPAGDHDEDGPSGSLPYGDGYSVAGTGGSVLEDPTNVNEYPLGRKERPRPRLRQLPVVRKRRGKADAKTVEEALDLGPLQLLPPHIANALSPSQESWLAARLLTYSDKQVSQNLGIPHGTFRTWLKNSPPFREAYDFVTLSLPELGMQLNGLLLTKAMLFLWSQLDHPNTANRFKAAELIHKRQTAAEAAAARREAGPAQHLTVIGDSAFDVMRKRLEGGWGAGALPVQDTGATRLGDGAVLPSGGTGTPHERASRLANLLDSGDWPSGSGEVLQDTGRE